MHRSSTHLTTALFLSKQPEPPLTARAFKPLRCEVQDFDYDSGFEFSVLVAEDPALVYMGKLRTSQYQDPKALAEVFRRWRIVVAAKGHELAPWTGPS